MMQIDRVYQDFPTATLATSAKVYPTFSTDSLDRLSQSFRPRKRPTVASNKILKPRTSSQFAVEKITINEGLSVRISRFPSLTSLRDPSKDAP